MKEIENTTRNILMVLQTIHQDNSAEERRLRY